MLYTSLFCLFPGFIDDVCFLRRDDIPHLLVIDGGDVCIVNDTETCAEVHLNAEYFAVNPSFACKVVVSA